MEEAAVRIVRRLQDAGHEALFAGGCVRDRLRGVAAKDIDIATSATPEEVIELFPGSDAVGAHFGVIIVKRGGHAFEVATFRRDGRYSDGRRPDSVSFSNSREDARRRDFTVNGMFYDPVRGETLDYVGGREDLEKQLIRAIGKPEERFREDFLRLLRAIRFATVLDFEIEAATWTGLVATASNISIITPERIRDELDKIWLSPNRLRGFDLLVESGLMETILPEIIDLKGCEQPPQWHPEGDVFVHTRLMLSHLAPEADLPLVLSVLFHDIGKPASFSRDEKDGRIRFNRHDKIGAEMAEAILKRLRYPNAIIDAVVSAVSVHMRFAHVQEMKTSTLKRFLSRDRFEDELELHRVDCESSNRRLENYEFLRGKLEEFSAEDQPLIPERFLTGKDLIERGVAPGPDLGEILIRAQDLQLEGTLTSREDSLKWLEEELRRRR